MDIDSEYSPGASSSPAGESLEELVVSKASLKRYRKEREGSRAEGGFRPEEGSIAHFKRVRGRGSKP